MEVILQQFANLSILIYIVSTMLSMGLSFFPKQFIEPLQDKKLILKSLAANFILVPLLTYIILQLIPLQPGLAIGLVLMAAGAGSPFMLKLVQFIKADMAFAVGLMLILSTVTLIYLPLSLSFLLPDISVNSLSIAVSLLVLIFLPLLGGTALKWRYSKLAEIIKPTFNQISNIFLFVVVLLYLGLNYQDFLSVFGTGGLLAALIFVLASYFIGYMLGGPSKNTKTVLGMGTAIRNSSAAFVVALANFSAQYEVMAMIIVVYSLSIIVMMLISGEIGKRTKKSEDI
ncbi:bile acid:sodium symporter family protein [Methanobacterium alkalithermotolerans]|uniref:Bile acid:sodium symporter family protein n=1 Tax=Methanobacterium alkalithermotolerans TaxID=2731220 RepID=A0A8T8K6E9_9EURY|nr:bile acid:sodium symporter [Methanobacterium alkalithermotolerans]QUH22693.1 bile acid:sodium symporter family protein [Methanobacterium alkalithermotolerans]